MVFSNKVITDLKRFFSKEFPRTDYSIQGLVLQEKTNVIVQITPLNTSFRFKNGDIGGFTRSVDIQPLNN